MQRLTDEAKEGKVVPFLPHLTSSGPDSPTMSCMDKGVGLKRDLPECKWLEDHENQEPIREEAYSPHIICRGNCHVS